MHLVLDLEKLNEKLMGGGVGWKSYRLRGSPLLMANQKSRVSVNCSHHLEP